MDKKKSYMGVGKNADSSWQFTVEKASGKLKIGVGYSTAKVAALMRDEYILKHNLDQKLNFPTKRMRKMRIAAYEKLFGKLK